MKIIEVNDYSHFLCLKEKWDEVLRKCDHSVFSTWEWLSEYWKQFGTNKELLVLLEQEDDKIVGIAPLTYNVCTMFGLRRGKIEFLGSPYSDYNDFVLTNEEKCLPAFFHYLNHISKKWDCIDLIDIPAYSKSIPFLKKFSKTLRPAKKCPYLLLPKSHEIFINSLDHKLRKDLHRNSKRLKTDFKMEFVDYSGTLSCVEGMKIFFRLHQKRWMVKGSPGAFADPKFRDFHLEIAKTFSEKGWLGLLILRLSGKPVAASYGFKYRRKYYYYLSGFDPDYSAYSVGNELISSVIAKCISEGFEEFDFLRGAQKYKDRWNTMTRWNRHAILIRDSPITKVENWLYDQYWLQGSRLKYLLRMKQ